MYCPGDRRLPKKHARATKTKPQPARATEARRTLFAAEYALDGNGTRAALAAGCSPKSAHVTAARWLTDAKVQAAIACAQQKALDKLAVTKEMIIAEMVKLGFSDIGEIFTSDTRGIPAILPMSEWTPRARAAVTGIKVRHYGAIITASGEQVAPPYDIVEFKLADKVGPLIKLGEQIGMFAKNVKHSGSITVEEKANRVAALLNVAASRAAVANEQR